MRWRKLGRIFNPVEHRLANGCLEFAQSPQALVCDEFVRIYFSTRSVDPVGGKFRSHIAYVDMSFDFTQVLGVSHHTVIPLGELGAFDEHGIFPMNVVRRGDSVLGYTCGWSRRVSVSVETGIGVAVSTDGGCTFQKRGTGPVLSASLNEPCLVGDPFVRIVEGTFHMWYIFGTGWKANPDGAAPDRVYKIGHAASADGLEWRKEEARQIIPSRLGDDECQALPTVVTRADVHHMFFCYRQAFDFRRNRERGYRIGHAWSEDLVDWIRDDENPAIDVSEGEWDGDMMCYPHAFNLNDRTYLLYNGNEFGRYGFGAAVLE
jgi:hypothetical protein